MCLPVLVPRDPMGRDLLHREQDSGVAKILIRVLWSPAGCRDHRNVVKPHAELQRLKGWKVRPALECQSLRALLSSFLAKS